MSVAPQDSSPIGPTAVKVLLMEAAVVAALWLFGRYFSA
jgi:hypothetical protein